VSPWCGKGRNSLLTRSSGHQFLRLAACAVALIATVCLANAQDYPDKPVRIITHSAPGGSPDALLRLVGDRLSQMWGRQVVVLNHPGAGGAIAARTAAQAA
jgi:tripartite-type tricarboxylate transporter receptor subunit TctC